MHSFLCRDYQISSCVKHLRVFSIINLIYLFLQKYFVPDLGSGSSVTLQMVYFPLQCIPCLFQPIRIQHERKWSWPASKTWRSWRSTYAFCFRWASRLFFPVHEIHILKDMCHPPHGEVSQSWMLLAAPWMSWTSHPQISEETMKCLCWQAT